MLLRGVLDPKGEALNDGTDDGKENAAVVVDPKLGCWVDPPPKTDDVVEADPPNGRDGGD